MRDKKRRFIKKRQLNLKRATLNTSKTICAIELLKSAQWVSSIGAQDYKTEAVLSNVFGSKKQEELFAECAKESMSTKIRLTW